MSRLRERAKALKREVFAVYLASKDPRTPWAARIIVAVVVAYALSPIDLIPDFIPILGILDDLILIPAGIALALRMIPPEVLTEARIRAADMDKPTSRLSVLLIVCTWLLLAAATGWLAWIYL